jgi:hypothetical protein
VVLLRRRRQAGRRRVLLVEQVLAHVAIAPGQAHLGVGWSVTLQLQIRTQIQIRWLFFHSDSVTGLRAHVAVDATPGHDADARNRTCGVVRAHGLADQLGDASLGAEGGDAGPDAAEFGAVQSSSRTVLNCAELH